MIISYDIETEGLNATKFRFGVIYFGNNRYEIFTKREEMWNRIIELGKKEAKRNRVLTCYAHNAQFDYYGIANLNDKHLVYKCLKPFIVLYQINGKNAIKFLDSLSLFGMPLSKLGDIIGKPKIETPNKMRTGQEYQITEEDISYCKRDCEIVYDSIFMLKDKLSKEDINLRGLYTTSQIAINYFMNFLRKNKQYHELFKSDKLLKLHDTRNVTHIHNAYRGGRVEAFKLGKFTNINYIDCNNLYGYASMNIRFPDLRSEKFEYNPLRYCSPSELFNKIGISKALVYNKNCKLGLLAITTPNGGYYPKKGKYLLGTWTHIELAKAIQKGYEILDIEWTITWKEFVNPFKILTNRLYELRKQSKNSFEKLFYKDMQNRSYGKLAQKRTEWELKIDNVEEINKYISHNWKAIKGIGDEDYLYEKRTPAGKKNFYAPIIPTLINAYAKVYMYDYMNKFSYENLLYHDTDSIMFKGDIPKNIKIGDNIGEFKIEHQNSKAIIYARKTYCIGNDIKISGYRKRDLTITQFEKGQILNNKMITLMSTKDFSKIGTFTKEKRDLYKDMDKYTYVRGILDKQNIYIDKSLKNINYFIPKLGKITNGK